MAEQPSFSQRVVPGDSARFGSAFNTVAGGKQHHHSEQHRSHHNLRFRSGNAVAAGLACVWIHSCMQLVALGDGSGYSGLRIMDNPSLVSIPSFPALTTLHALNISVRLFCLVHGLMRS